MEYLVRDSRIFVSKDTEGTPSDAATLYNAVKTGGSSFLRAITTNRGFTVPQLTFVDDLQKIGHGNEFLNSQRVNYWTHPVMTMANEANVDMMAIMLLRALSGSVTSQTAALLPDGITASPAGGPNEHIGLMQTAAQGRQLLSFNMVAQSAYQDDSNRGYDFLFPGCVVDSFALSQARGETPTWSAEVVGSGKFVTPSGLVLAAGANQVPAYLEENYIHSASIGLVYTNPTGPTTINLAQEGIVRSWNFQYNNNARRDDRRIGDPFRVSNDPTSGAFVNRILRGVRNCTFQAVISANSSLREFLLHRDNVLVQNIVLTLKGNIYGGSGAYAAQANSVKHNYTVEITIPRSYVSGLAGGEDNDDATLTLDFRPAKVSDAQEYVTARIINGQSTYYPFA